MCQLSLLNQASPELRMDDHVYKVTCPGGCIIAWPGIDFLHLSREWETEHYLLLLIRYEKLTDVLLIAAMHRMLLC